MCCYECNGKCGGTSMIGEIVKVIVDRPLGSYHPKHEDILRTKFSVKKPASTMRKCKTVKCACRLCSIIYLVIFLAEVSL